MHAPRRPKPYETRGDAILAALPNPDAYSIIVAEVGVWRGDLSRYLLENCPRMRLHMVDRWEPAPEGHQYRDTDPVMGKATREQFETAERLAKERTADFWERRWLHKGESAEIAERVFDRSLDLVFLDGDHRYEAVLDDLKAWARKVRTGGVIGGHDWGHPNKLWGVKRAVGDFFPGRDVEVGQNLTWFLRL